MPPYRKRLTLSSARAAAAELDAPSADGLDRIADELALRALLVELADEATALSVLTAARRVLLDSVRRHSLPVHDERIEALAEVLERVPIDDQAVSELIEVLR